MQSSSRRPSYALGKDTAAPRFCMLSQQIAAHASPKTTKLYDRTADTISLDEIERIVI
jgi:hypothetical protein